MSAAKPRSCAELGLCQSRAVACQGCTHPRQPLPPADDYGFMFAPGVIEGPSPRRRRWLTPNRRAYLELGAAAILMTMAAVVIGVSLAGWL